MTILGVVLRRGGNNSGSTTPDGNGAYGARAGDVQPDDRLPWKIHVVVPRVTPGPTAAKVSLNSAALLGVENMLIFLVGLLLGVLIGGALCVRFLRREIAANVGPQLQQLNLKIETLESVLNLALATRHSELASFGTASTRNEGR